MVGWDKSPMVEGRFEEAKRTTGHIENQSQEDELTGPALGRHSAKMTIADGPSGCRGGGDGDDV